MPKEEGLRIGQGQLCYWVPRDVRPWISVTQFCFLSHGPVQTPIFLPGLFLVSNLYSLPPSAPAMTWPFPQLALRDWSAPGLFRLFGWVRALWNSELGWDSSISAAGVLWVGAGFVGLLCMALGSGTISLSVVLGGADAMAPNESPPPSGRVSLLPQKACVWGMTTRCSGHPALWAQIRIGPSKYF